MFAAFFKKTNTEPLKVDSLYDIKLKSIDGKDLNLQNFKGKFMLFVNVASKCGFTKQYTALQELQDTYKDKLVVIGLPCNQFANQEPADESEIKEFCNLNYGISFPLTEKIKVHGPEIHPLYAWLTQKQNNQHRDSTVRWNFQKYLVSPEGKLVDFYYSTTNPLNSKITKHIENHKS